MEALRKNDFPKRKGKNVCIKDTQASLNDGTTRQTNKHDYHKQSKETTNTQEITHFVVYENI